MLLRSSIHRVLFIGVAALPGAAPAFAQEALRTSLATQEAMRSRQEAQGRHYNLKMGPVSLQLEAATALEFNDNVNLSRDNPESDLILRPQLRTTTTWQVTDKNDLSLNLGVGYEKYVSDSNLDNVFVTPGSDLEFNIFVKNVVINLHDRFLLSQESYTQPSVSGTAKFGRFENTAGLLASWDLNKVIQTFSYDHHTYLATSERDAYLDRSSELFSAQTAYVINSQSRAGIQVGGAFTDYEKDVLNDLTSFNAGPFFSSQLTPYFNLRLYAGYTAYYLDTPTNFPGGDTISAVYSDVSIRHLLNSQMAYSLSFGRQIQLGIYSDTLDVYFARLSIHWRLVRKVTLVTPFSFEHAEESGNDPERFSRGALGIEARYQITEKLSSSASYQFTKKVSNVARNDYSQNQLVFNLAYRF